jgi:hypothetical protein
VSQEDVPIRSDTCRAGCVRLLRAGMEKVMLPGLVVPSV